MLSKKAFLSLLALFTGGFVPINLIVLSFGYAQYFKGITMGPKVIKTAHEFGEPYMLFVYIPSMLILTWIIFYSKKNFPDLYKRIVVGLLAGAIATIGLDWLRQMGVIASWLPGDTPEMFGKMVTGSSDFNSYYWIGQLIHFMNGASFGLIFTLVFGNFISYNKTVLWAIGWMLIMELGMMTGPPMGPMVGLFGIKYMWPQLFLITLAAHIVHGTILGLLVHHWLGINHTKWLIPFLKDKS
ncbi:hypothetical protein [uncultured Salegentibacter sp.]|uniref:hypothetical protein n=1 Tax=uncultured Salegentibacter sp. TaxID=259320 RepID=UPI0030D89507